MVNFQNVRRSRCSFEVSTFSTDSLAFGVGYRPGVVRLGELIRLYPSIQVLSKFNKNVGNQRFPPYSSIWFRNISVECRDVGAHLN